ncbi:MAG: MFS transporter, partial [Lachnospiraceae bacterium]|nr:MFS transporter [Lachnospiraceae bacterium]
MRSNKKTDQTVAVEPTTIWNRTFISVFIANALLYFGEQMIQTLITSYAKYLGAVEVTIGLVASAFALTSIIFKVISAPAIDTYNRKYILFGAMVVIGISALGYAFSTNVTTVFGFRLLQGAGKAFTATCCLALATDALPKDKLAQGIGFFSLAQAICQALGPTIGKFIEGAFGFRVTFLVSATCLFVGAFCALNIKNSFVRTKK